MVCLQIIEEKEMRINLFPCISQSKLRGVSRGTDWYFLIQQDMIIQMIDQDSRRTRTSINLK